MNDMSMRGVWRKVTAVGATSVIVLTTLTVGTAAPAQAAEVGECDVIVQRPALTENEMFVNSNVTGECNNARNVRVRFSMWTKQFGEERLANLNYPPQWGGRDYGDLNGNFDLGGRHVSTIGGFVSVKVRGQVCYDLPSGSTKCRDRWEMLT